ncbi:hypothetical protein HanPSC8_Chr17g0758921 [Helianthus annuus]|nr:hypothetical protein HanPSC8_Chr17g0758921 [Helianthus annuus]
MAYKESSLHTYFFYHFVPYLPFTQKISQLWPSFTTTIIETESKEMPTSSSSSPNPSSPIKSITHYIASLLCSWREPMSHHCLILPGLQVSRVPPFGFDYGYDEGVGMWTEVRRYSRCFQDFKPRIKSSLQGPYRLILCTDLPVWGRRWFAVAGLDHEIRNCYQSC